MKPRDILTTLRLDDGRRWIDAAHDWQKADAVGVLEGDRPYHYLTRSRGSSKTTDLSAVALSALLASEDRLRGYWLASDADQARLSVDTVAGFVARSPALADRVDIQTRRIVVPETAGELTILPSDAAGTWGLTPHWVFADELANWQDVPSSRRLWEAASSAVAKRKDARMVVLTTASTPDHFACEVLEHARKSKLWRCSEREGPSPWMDADKLEEQRQRLPAAVFEQLFLNRWVPAEGAFLAAEAVDEAFTLTGPTAPWREQHVYSAALDLGSVHDRTAFAVVHRDGPAVVMDGLRVWQGNKKAPVNFQEVEEVVAEGHREYGFRLSFDRWQALDLAQRLTARGVSCSEYVFSRPNKQRLAQTLLSLLNGGNLKLYEPGGLKDELLNLKLVQNGDGSWGFDHRPGQRDDMAVAVSMAATSALERPTFTAQPVRWREPDAPPPITRGLMSEAF